MKIKICIKLCIVFLVFFSNTVFSTGRVGLAQEDSTAIRIEKVKELITYLEFALNTIGDAYTPPRE
jgi:hypothetical protein